MIIKLLIKESQARVDIPEFNIDDLIQKAKSKDREDKSSEVNEAIIASGLLLAKIALIAPRFIMWCSEMAKKLLSNETVSKSLKAVIGEKGELKLNDAVDWVMSFAEEWRGLYISIIKTVVVEPLALLVDLTSEEEITEDQKDQIAEILFFIVVAIVTAASLAYGVQAVATGDFSAFSFDFDLATLSKIMSAPGGFLNTTFAGLVPMGLRMINPKEEDFDGEFGSDEAEQEMQVTSEELKRIIQEELAAVLDEKKGKKRKAAKKKKRKKKKKKKAKRDACYHKVRSRYDVWPSAYASGALVKCRKVGAKNWGNSKKNESLNEEFSKHDMFDPKTGKKFVANVEQDHLDMAKKGYVHVDPKKIEKILRDEGGAAGIDPFLKEFGDDMKSEIEKALKAMPNVGKHEDGDFILSDKKKIKIVKEVKNCGCGMNPCKTYGKQ